MSAALANINYSVLPLEVRAKLAELDIEISEGDITQKGYEKKRYRLLEPYLHELQKAATRSVGEKHRGQVRNLKPPRHQQEQTRIPPNKSKKQTKVQMSRHRHSRRDDRYRSDAHTEAVQAALAKHKTKRIPVLPLPVKRRSLMVHGGINSVGDSSDDDMETDASTGDDGSLQRRTDDSSSLSGGSAAPSPLSHQRGNIQTQLTKEKQVISRSSSSNSKSRSSADDMSSGERRRDDSSSSSSKLKSYPQPTPLAQKLADIMPQILPGSRPLSQNLPPDVANISMNPPSSSNTTPSSMTTLESSDVNNVWRSMSSRPSLTSMDGEEENLSVTKVSAKIQQLLLTLKRPRKKPLAEYFQDDQEELLENIGLDENAPKPEGPVTAPREGGQLPSQSNIPHSIEAAIHRCGTANPKAPCLTSVDMTGKTAYTLTYGKLLSRMRRVAYTLQGKKNGLLPGQRVALVFPNSEPVPFTCAFYGCMLAGLVPVVVEVPMSSEDPGSSQLGFLLGSCGVATAITSDHCLKRLPKNERGEVNQLKGWPKLQWIVTDSNHLQRPPSNWEPSGHNLINQLAYIEYKTGKEGSVVGVAHTRAAIHRHCRALVGALCYNAADIMVNLLDFKRGFGLVHGILASMLSGMHVYCIPYALMKQNPMQWLNIITKNKASLALVKSRDLHWTLAMQRDNPNINLKTLRMLLVSDGANPWSIGSCDMFLTEFEKRGLHRDALCPCAWSAEALTVAARRPGTHACRTALSLQDMSYKVIHEEPPNSQAPSVVLQDCGNALLGCTVAVVSVTGSANLCRTDEIGEILVCPKPTDSADEPAGSWYYGLSGISEKMFRCHPVDESNHGQTDNGLFIRTGLLGYMNPSGRLMVTGKSDGMVQIAERIHNSDDIVATVLAIEPIRFVYRGRIAVFGVTVLRDERLIVIVEQKPDCSEELCFKWMSSVMQAVESVHGVGVYCLSLLAPNALPRTPLGGVHLSETRSRFLEGNLSPRNILMSPHQCVLNLPKPRQKHSDVGPASILQGQVITGVRLAESRGRQLTPLNDDEVGKGESRKFQYLSEILKWRAQSTPDHVLLTQMGSKGVVTNHLTCSQLHKKAERIAQLLLSHPTPHGLNSLSTGDHVALLFPPSVDLTAAFYGCLYAGCVPIPVRPPHMKSIAATLPTVRMVVEVSKVAAVLSWASVIKLLRSKEAIAALQSTTTPLWPPLLDIEDSPKKRVPISYRPPTPEMLSYIDFSITTAGTLAGIKMSHYSSSQLCRSMKLQCELYPSRSVALCLDPYSGLGLALWCLSSIYSGHQSILIAPAELETNPQLWLQTLSQFKVRDAFISYGVVEFCTKGLAAHIPTLKSRGVSLAHIRTCVIVAEERPRVRLTSNFTKLFRDLGLSSRAVSTAFGCRVNVGICLQPPRLGILSEQIISEEPYMGASCPDPTTVYVDMRALRNDRVALVEKGSPHSLCLMETGKILPGTKVVIADPDTLGQCSDSRLGEVWVSSPHTAKGYYSIYGGDADNDYLDHFQGYLKTGDTQTKYARTGFLGFLKRTELTSATGERHDALYIVGSLEETLELRGMRYHPIDIENAVVRCSNRIIECAVFHSTNLLVVVVELDGVESTALDLIPLVTNVILEEHYLIAGVVAVVDPGSIPVNSRGEKQRMHLRDSFLQDRLDPIYVAYNM
nr:disco-interacting protein 2 homolog C isoform X1 [Ciona intestinalis]|eukprot:XP_018668928.1 disco-interacting protein 2 homolog C isoform X1 [Ciona intestinalis]